MCIRDSHDPEQVIEQACNVAADCGLAFGESAVEIENKELLRGASPDCARILKKDRCLARS